MAHVYVLCIRKSVDFKLTFRFELECGTYYATVDWEWYRSSINTFLDLPVFFFTVYVCNVKHASEVSHVRKHTSVPHEYLYDDCLNI